MHSNNNDVDHTSDADTLIVRHVLQSATSCETVLIGEDTDPDQHNIFFSSSSGKIWDIKKTRQLLGNELCNSILFLHGISGCDTTSHPFSIGKGSVVSKFKKSPQLRAAAKAFMETSEREVIIKAGEEAMVTLYGGSKENLNELRYRSYMKKVASQKQAVQPYSLRPTCSASKFTCLRVYHQVAVWKNLSDSVDEDPCGWG